MSNSQSVRICQTAICALWICLLTACSIPKEARQGSALLSAYTVEVQKEIDRFSSQQLKVDQARLAAIGVTEESTITTAEHSKGELAIWQTRQLGTKRQDFRVLLYEAVVTSSDASAQQFQDLEARERERAQSIAAIQSAVNLDSKKLGEVARALATLSEKPNAEDQVEFLVGYFKQVQNSLKDFTKAAERQAQCAEAETQSGTPDKPCSAPTGDGKTPTDNKPGL